MIDIKQGFNIKYNATISKMLDDMLKFCERSKSCIFNISICDKNSMQQVIASFANFAGFPVRTRCWQYYYQIDGLSHLLNGASSFVGRTLQLRKWQ